MKTLDTQTFEQVQKAMNQFAEVTRKTVDFFQEVLMHLRPVSREEDRSKYTERQWRIRQRFIKAWKNCMWASAPHWKGTVFIPHEKRNAYLNGNHVHTNGNSMHRNIIKPRSRLKSDKRVKVIESS